jgi:hypothetical protein
MIDLTKFSGKGFYIHQIPMCDGGNIITIAQQAAAAGLSHVLVKICDGAGNYNVTPAGVDLAEDLVFELHRRNVQVWGWGYIYGKQPADEARTAVKRINATGVDGFVINAEKEFKALGMSRVADTYLGELRKGYAGPLALSSYRYPSYHPQFPWKNFLNRVDLNMPQVYWEQAHNPDYQLARCVREFEAMDYVRPIFPTGSTYKNNGWVPTLEDVKEFIDTANELGLAGFNFWDWQHCRRDHPDLWELIAGGKPEPAGVIATYKLTYSPFRYKRSGPGTSYAWTGKVLKNEIFGIIRRMGDWGQMPDLNWIKVSNGVQAIA